MRFRTRRLSLRQLLDKVTTGESLDASNSDRTRAAIPRLGLVDWILDDDIFEHESRLIQIPEAMTSYTSKL